MLLVDEVMASFLETIKNAMESTMKQPSFVSFNEVLQCSSLGPTFTESKRSNFEQELIT